MRTKWRHISLSGQNEDKMRTKHYLKLRTGNHTLSTEVDRYRSRKTYEECICNACDLNQIEDLHHVIVECPKYNEIRKRKVEFVMNCNKMALYSILNNLTPQQIKQITQFMSIVQEERKQ